MKPEQSYKQVLSHGLVLISGQNFWQNRKKIYMFIQNFQMAHYNLNNHSWILLTSVILPVKTVVLVLFYLH